MFLKLLLTGTALATFALAQGGDTGGGGGNSGGRGQMDTGADRGGMGVNMRPAKESKADQMINRLKMSKDQKSEFDTILQSAAKENAPLVQQVMQTRTAFAAAMINGKTGADLEPLNKALAEAQFAMLGLEVKTFQRILTTLKPNQTAKAPEAFDLMADIFLPQGGPSGGGMGMRGRGGR